MKVLHIISSLETGGAQKLLSELLPELKILDVDVELVVFRKTGSRFEKQIENAGIPLHSLGIESNYSPAILTRLRPYMKSADIVHVHLFPVLYETVLANIGIGKPIIYTEHSTSNNRRTKPYFRPIEKWMYGRLAKVIAISRQTKDALDHWLDYCDGDSEKVVVVNNGISLVPVEAPSRALPEKTVLMVSRFTEAKDHATVLHAMKHIATPGVTLAFAGTGATMDSCRRLALELGIQNQVLFLGDRDDAQALMAQASIGVQSSHWEGFGLTAVEFMAAGTPVVASDVEGLRQVVEGAGIVFPQGDYVALARTIDLLFTDSELYSSCVYGGKSRAGEYSIKNTARTYSELYERILK